MQHEGLLDHFLLTFMYRDEPVQNGVKVTLSIFHPSFGYVLTCVTCSCRLSYPRRRRFHPGTEESPPVAVEGLIGGSKITVEGGAFKQHSTASCRLCAEPLMLQDLESSAILFNICRNWMVNTDERGWRQCKKL